MSGVGPARDLGALDSCHFCESLCLQGLHQLGVRTLGGLGRSLVAFLWELLLGTEVNLVFGGESSVSLKLHFELRRVDLLDSGLGHDHFALGVLLRRLRVLATFAARRLQLGPAQHICGRRLKVKLAVLLGLLETLRFGDGHGGRIGWLGESGD